MSKNINLMRFFKININHLDHHVFNNLSSLIINLVLQAIRLSSHRHRRSVTPNYFGVGGTIHLADQVINILLT